MGKSLTDQDEGVTQPFLLRILSDGMINGDFKGNVRLADGQKIRLQDGTYVVQVWTDCEGRLSRGSLRRDGSEREIHFQSGDNLAKLIQDYLSRISY